MVTQRFSIVSPRPLLVLFEKQCVLFTIAFGTIYGLDIFSYFEMFSNLHFVLNFF